VTYEAVVWHCGRLVRARLQYEVSVERGYQVTRLVRIEELE
jgi:hypothetical protein